MLVRRLQGALHHSHGDDFVRVVVNKISSVCSPPWFYLAVRMESQVGVKVGGYKKKS